ncbi:MAG: hypothetical protein C4537_07890 [Acholeplasma sp.]|nr:MAG: hypothetical protein C4537_07890 [Acholeplasma sp.]
MRTKNIINIFICLLSLSLLLSGCSYSYRMTEYYSDDENYKTLSGEIIETEFDDKNGTLYIYIELEDTYHYNGFFKVISSNEQILSNSNFYEEVSVGDVITFTTAPRIFYDGYDRPIISLSFNNKVYLEFEQGKANLLESVK